MKTSGGHDGRIVPVRRCLNNLKYYTELGRYASSRINPCASVTANAEASDEACRGVEQTKQPRTNPNGSRSDPTGCHKRVLVRIQNLKYLKSKIPPHPASNNSRTLLARVSEVKGFCRKTDSESEISRRPTARPAYPDMYSTFVSGWSVARRRASS